MSYNGILQYCQNLSKLFVTQMICICLVIVVLCQLYSGSMALFKQDKRLVVNDQQRVVSPSTVNSDKNHRGLTQPFFGNYIPKAIDDASVKESVLNVKVVGILFAVREEDSQVILKIASGREQTFGVGDTVPGGAVIKRITAQGVLFERNGALESLSLPKNELIFDAQAKPLIGD